MGSVLYQQKTLSKCYDLPEGGEYIDYTIRTVFDTARKYKVLNANINVWIEEERNTKSFNTKNK